MSFITYLYIFHFIYLYIFIIHLAKLSTREDFIGQNVRGQTVLAKLSVAKLSYIRLLVTIWNEPILYFFAIAQHNS